MGDIHLVTGGAGYFGSILVDRLVEKGEKVRVLDLGAMDQAPPSVELVFGDVRSYGTVKRALEDVCVVHHVVAQVPLAKDPAAFWSVNRDGTRVLLDACIESGVKKVVHMSSSATYGAPETNPVDESTPPRPGESYGEAKLAAEHHCQSARQRGLDVSIVRPRTILGHGRLGIFQILFEWVRLGRNIPVFDAGDNRYQFVHADDLADACLLAAKREGPADYNIGAEHFGTMGETLDALVEHADTGSKVVGVPSGPAVWGMGVTSRLGLTPLGPYHALMYGKSMWFDVSKAKRELGWSARWDNIGLMIDTYDWYLKHREEVLARSGASPHRSALRQGALKLVSRLL